MRGLLILLTVWLSAGNTCAGAFLSQTQRVSKAKVFTAQGIEQSVSPEAEIEHFETCRLSPAKYKRNKSRWLKLGSASVNPFTETCFVHFQKQGFSLIQDRAASFLFCVERKRGPPLRLS